MARIKSKLKNSLLIYLTLSVIIIIETVFLYRTSKEYLLFARLKADTIQYDNQKSFLTPKPTPTATPLPTKEQTITTDQTNELNTEDNQQSTVNNQQNPTANNDSTANNYANQNKTYNFVYYYQCSSEYGSTPLPQGCNLCKAGCGPTTVAMILSTFIDKKWTPPAVLELYKSSYANGNRYAAVSCNGSYVDMAKTILSRFLYVGDYIFANKNGYNLDYVVNDMKSLIKNGYYIFALANYSENPNSGHFFWIIDIDENNNVWAYDPYYSKNVYIPLNENKFSPYPKYRFAFPFKKL
ncbi:MAG: hypothetical protein KatS3mg091_431 [Patescibacteria group bacterium]|nr:MAG: hypothetical protein KatS3mg091_431 [Patescibacteria group bacterium]